MKAARGADGDDLSARLPRAPLVFQRDVHPLADRLQDGAAPRNVGAVHHALGPVDGIRQARGSLAQRLELAVDNPALWSLKQGAPNLTLLPASAELLTAGRPGGVTAQQDLPRKRYTAGVDVRVQPLGPRAWRAGQQPSRCCSSR